MCLRQFIVSADRNITLAEYKQFLNFVNDQVSSGVLTRYGISLEKGTKTTSKYHIQCVFDFGELIDPPRDFASRTKKAVKFQDYLMKSRKAACFKKLEQGQSFLLLAAGYVVKDPLRLANSHYGISDEEFVENNSRYRILVERKEKKHMFVYPGRLYGKALNYAKKKSIRSLPEAVVAMFEDGYDLSMCIGKVDPDLNLMFLMDIGIRDPKEELMDILYKK